MQRILCHDSKSKTTMASISQLTPVMARNSITTRAQISLTCPARQGTMRGVQTSRRSPVCCWESMVSRGRLWGGREARWGTWAHQEARQTLRIRWQPTWERHPSDLRRIRTLVIKIINNRCSYSNRSSPTVGTQATTDSSRIKTSTINPSSTHTT